MVPCREKSFFLFLFLIFVYFFCLVHPSIPYNGDDWRYLSYARHAWPEAAEWNPARILPEVLLPAIGCMSAFLYKMGIDYISSVSIIYGIFLSFLLTVLAYNFYRLFCDILAGDNLGALLLVSFFMLSSFFMFEKCRNGNVFLFYATYFCTGIYYVASNIINSILTIILFRYSLNDSIIDDKEYSIPFLVLLMYISQFSMTFSTLISASSAFFIFIIKYKEGLIRKDYILLVPIVFFVIAASFDMAGNRFDALQKSEASLSTVIFSFHDFLLNLRNDFIGLCSLIILSYFITIYIKKEQNNVFYIIMMCLMSMFLIFFFDLVLSMRTMDFMKRIEATYGIFFFLLLSVTCCLCYLLKKFTLVKILLPMFILFLMVDVLHVNKIYADTYGADKRYIVESWLADIKKAENNGASSVVINVPQIGWPHPGEWFGEVVSQTLYAHRVTKNKMTIILSDGKSISQ